VPSEDAPEKPALSYVQEIGKSYRDAAEKLRARADVAAKSLGALATAALGAVGLAKFADVTPFPFDAGWWAWIALVGLVVSFVAMAVLVFLLTRTLAYLARPVVMSSDPTKIERLNDEEQAQVHLIFGEFEALNRVPSVRAYAARAYRLERIADRSDEQSAVRLRSRAALIAAEVLATLDRARHAVVRTRVSNVLFGRKAVAGFLLFLIALICFGISADYLSAKRNDEVALAKSCGDAHAAGATNLPGACDEFVDREETDELALAKSCGEAREAGATTLPEICNSYVPGDNQTPAEETASPRQEAALALQDLASRWVRCERAAETATAGPEMCAPIRRAIIGATGGGAPVGSQD
jgi:hypothetical protein